MTPFAIALLLALAGSQDAPSPAAPPATPAAPAAEAPDQNKPEAASQPAPPDPKAARDVSQFNLGDGGLAIEGYDPVSYFPEGGGKPQEGDEKFAYDFRGVHYRFASAEHRELFVNDPAKFEPAYGGWCAYGMAKDDKVEVDPESFLLVDGHLMLYFDGLFADTRAKWLDEGTETLKPRADASWKKFLEKQKR